MEIKSIKKIQNVGTFSSFEGASFRFEKLNFIYGLNAYGKTTLTDIFQSLQDDDNQYVINRKTIPEQNNDQSIILSVKEHEKEKEIKFQNQAWKNNSYQKHIEVFGTDFIHRNVFTGLEVKRKNKENFTRFVLGNEGVSLANTIANNRQTWQKKKKDLQTKLPDHIKDKSKQEVERFLTFAIEGLNEKEIEENLITLQKEKHNEKQRLHAPQKISSLPVIDSLDIPESKILEYFKNINELLQTDFSQIKKDVLDKINHHIQNNFRDTDGAENWIKQGLSNCKDKDKCSFCGQDLQNVQDLMDAYHSYFDDTYNQFIHEIERGLSTQLSNFQNQEYNVKTHIQEILTNIVKYKEFITDEVFQNLQTNFEIELETLNKDEETIKAHKEQLLKTFQEKIQQKNKKPYEKVALVDNESLNHSLNAYQKTLNTLDTIIKEIKHTTEHFKAKYTDTTEIENRITEIDNKVGELEFQKARIEQDAQCKAILQLKTNIEKQQKELDNSQSNYLQKYFNKINQLFKKFGSEDFTLEKTKSMQGYQPTYFLDVKFRGESIKHENLQNILSESDKRALAFAIFWSRIDLKNPEEKKETVIILDDPVTSFDDNRITNTIGLMKESLQDISQIIVLTHYPNFIRIFCERTKESEITTKFFEINKDNKTSQLTNTDRERFTTSQYEKIFSKIMGYINKEHDCCIKSDLRPFLESLYIPTVFAKALREAKNEKKDLFTLEKTIDALFSNNEHVKNKMHELRNTLNPDAHIFTSNNTEDVRNFAKNMVEFLYSFELKNE